MVRATICIYAAIDNHILSLSQGIIYSLLDKKKEADEQFELYHNLIPEEYPQRSFIDDVILAAKTESQEQLRKDFDSQFSYKK